MNEASEVLAFVRMVCGEQCMNYLSLYIPCVLLERQGSQRRHIAVCMARGCECSELAEKVAQCRRKQALAEAESVPKREDGGWIVREYK